TGTWGRSSRGRGYCDPMCQCIVGTQIDAAVGKLLVEAVTPMALELAIAVQQEIQSRLDEADRLRHRQVERAQYEADHARHRYMQVDAKNRLVADSLEADWNAKLRVLRETQEEYQRQRAADRIAVDDEERQRVLALAADFPAAWCSSTTPQRERKRMLALLIEDVTLIKGQQLTAAIRFRGGATTTLTLPRPLTAQQLRVTHDDVRRELDALLNEYTDAQVAHVLNERGLRTGAGAAFDATSVQWVRFAGRLKSLKQRMLDAGWLTSAQMKAQLGLSRTTLGTRRRAGRLPGRICNELGQWLYWPHEGPPPQRSPPTTPSLAPNDTSTAGAAV
ncbi:MAG TPA: recombinase family protein, partial [Thermoleophilia bacterium]|nr:recombinase family protein [Thermoleophilia bacterium]